MTIQNGNKGYDIQFVPLFGFSVGYLYYHPSQEDVEDDWHRHQILLGIFAILITTWTD